MAERYVRARLADPTHKLPFPDKPMLFPTSADGEIVDTWDPFFQTLLLDGSLVRVNDPLQPTAMTTESKHVR